MAAEFQGLRVLCLSPVSGYGGFNTSVHRVQALEELGCQVTVVDSAGALPALQSLLYRVRNKAFRWGFPVPLPDFTDHRGRLLAGASGGDWDVVWLERAITVGEDTLLALRASCPRAVILGFALDDMNARHNQSAQFLQALPHYDWFLTSKSYNVAELRERGCPKVLFVPNAYDPASFRPVDVGPDDQARLGGDVGFIGTYESERAQSLQFLAEQGFHVRVWGSAWSGFRGRHPNLKIEGKPLYGEDFARACGAFKINLGFLRKSNRDLQTTRSIEIPACGGFMLAERTQEHLELFHEGSEAEFFESREELALKCARYLGDEEGRLRVARGGLARCQSAGYSNLERLRQAWRTVLGRGRHSLDGPESHDAPS